MADRFHAHAAALRAAGVDYRDSVDEWAHWERDGFEPVATLLAEANARLASLHARDDDDIPMEEDTVARISGFPHAARAR